MKILITGVSSGLGYALAKFALDAGHEVWGLSRRKPEGLSGNFHFIQGDLEKLDKIGDSLSVLSGVKNLDYVILNAGILGPVDDVKKSSMEGLKLVMDINLWSNKIIIDYLTDIAEINQVIGISSGASVSGARGWSGYGISKAAFNMMIKLYASEMPGIHFTALAPGLVQTAMQDIISEHKEPEKFPTIQRLQKARGTADMPQPEEVAARIWDILPKLKSLESGSYADIRKLEI